ncbi:hypothetical protein SAMN05421813_1466 [Daejeonella rubra]|uniref:Uncharacterized protein n=1 Tax=Daejeonella rubra TaxID=990371 RepID=A0A1G9YVQ1_9SPHI|nr:hypothetical protein [Daejeonella rubra]SDN13252.1 hypothetical protein SAMN05421813_1466 [Daejeonella rubra]
MKIKNQELIKEFKEDEAPRVMILKGEPFLGDVIDELPSGIIDKSETGIGATTLEIDSNRNSIIVVPLKAIAASKAKKHKSCLYVGGDIGEIKRPTDKQILEYSQSKGDKKFLVVADSLKRLFDVLGVETCLTYFLMIDEVDSFQLEGSYRERLEGCLDYYKMFPRENRALVSSTLLKFSDPELLKEDKSIFKYENSRVRDIDLYYSDNEIGAAFDHIARLYKEKPNDKIVIAYNSVHGSIAIAEKLINDFGVAFEDIKILCSANRKQDVKHFVSELSNGILEGRINFMTSAYFVGVDIEEKYHCICISNSHPNFRHTLLSVSRLQQIAGRCRKQPLLSESIFYGSTIFSPADVINIDLLIMAAKAKIKSLECIADNFKSNQILAKQLIKVRELIIGTTDVLQYNFVRTNLNNEFVVSYFNIDACVENMETAKVLYTDRYTLHQWLLISGHNVTWNFTLSDTYVDDKPSNFDEAKQEQVEVSLAKLQELVDPKDVLRLIMTSESGHQTEIFNRYQALSGYFENKEELINNLKELSEQNATAFNNFKDAYKFAYDTTGFKDLIMELFPEGSKHNKSQIMEGLNQAYSKTGLHTISSMTTAVKTLNKYFKVKKDKRNYIDGLPTFEIGELYIQIKK